MKIGIPRALLYYYYFPFWKTLFESLGCSVTVSDETNTRLITEGIQVTVSELCVPVKIFNGHVLDLIEKGVDYIFVPQFVSQKKEWYCPKFIGLGEIVKYSALKSQDKILILPLESKEDIPDILSDYLPLCDKLSITKKQLKKALKDAKKDFLRFRALCRMGYTVTEAFDVMDGKKIALPSEKTTLTIGLMGYVYNVYDNFLSMNIIQRLRKMGVRVVTFDMIDEKKIERRLSEGKQPFWIFARKIYNASQYINTKYTPDGFIHLTAFCCGPDSVIGKLMELDLGGADIPFMTVRVDEHTGESHVQTRLEAFIDMLRIKKNKG